MKKLKSFEEFERLLEDRETFLLFAHTENCGVCLSYMPRVEQMAEEKQIPFYEALIEDIPMLRGQLGIFSVPVVLLFRQGKEYHKQARILDLQILEQRMCEVLE